MSLAGIVACQVGNAFVCRSNREPIWHLGLTTNRPLLIGIGAELALLLLFVYAPPLAALFNLERLGLQHWVLLMSFGPLLLMLEEGRKAVCRSRRFKTAQSSRRGSPDLGVTEHDA